MRARALVTAVAAAALFAAVAAPSASAAEYKVQLCGAGIPVSPDIAFAEEAGSSGLETELTCGGRSFGGIRQQATAAAVNGGISWTLQAPQGITIKQLEATRESTGDWEDLDFIWRLTNGAGAVLDRINGREVGGQQTYPVNSTSVTARLRCVQAPCSFPRFTPGVVLKSIVATLDDPTPPEAAIAAAPLTAAPLHGTVEIRFAASDVGSGIQSSFLSVDGRNFGLRSDENDGKCVAPFRFLVPCRSSLDASFPLNTTRLSDGPHQIQVGATDAVRQEGRSPELTIVVDNTTPPPGSGPDGGSAGGGRQPDPRPSLSAVSLARKSVKATRGKTKLRFTGSEAGKLSIAVSPLRRKKTKTVARPLASLTRQVAAGPGSLALSAKIGKRRLRPGTYTLTVTLTDAAGQASAPARLRLRVLPR